MLDVLIIPNGFQTQYTAHLVAALARAGMRVCMPSSDIIDETSFADPVRVISVRRIHNEDRSRIRKLLDASRYYLGLMRFLIVSKVRIVHMLWLRFPVLDGLVLSTAIRILGKRLILTVHDPLPHHRQDSKLEALVHRMIYKIPHGLIVHSPAVRDFMTRRLGVQCQRILYVEHGLYDARIEDSKTQEEAREILGTPVNKKTMLFFGYIRPYKGLETALNALDDLRGDHPDLLLIVAGNISDSYRERLQARFNIESRADVHCRFGYVPDESVPLLFQAADVVLLPYLEGSQSGVMFMSWSWGRPVIASDAGDFPNQVTSIEGGLVFAADRASELADRIRQGYSSGLFSSSDVRARLQRSARNKYSWDNIAEEMCRWYKRVAFEGSARERI